MYTGKGSISIPIKTQQDEDVKKIRPVSIPIFIERHWEPVKVTIPPPPQFDNSKDISWTNRKQNINQAISWLRTELSNLKIQDQQILGEIRSCQNTIENMKMNRSAWHESWDMSESDPDEDEEDGDISDFENQSQNGFSEGKDRERQNTLEPQFFRSRLSPFKCSTPSAYQVSSIRNSHSFHNSSSPSPVSPNSFLRRDLKDFSLRQTPRCQSLDMSAPPSFRSSLFRSIQRR